MIRVKIMFLGFLFFATIDLKAQNENPKINYIHNLGLNIGGSSSTYGFFYEYYYKEKKSIELGVGLLGGGLGLSYYKFNNFSKKKVNPYWGVRSSYNIQGSGGSRIINYLPIGIKIKTISRLLINIDLGPTYLIQLTPNGRRIINMVEDYPQHLLRIYGGFKLGFCFGNS